MPEGSSLARTDAVIRKMSEIGMNTEGVDYAVAFPGLTRCSSPIRRIPGRSFWPETVRPA
jgi:multidrug efflux pump subunit AcrB